MQDNVFAGQKFGKWKTVSIYKYGVDGEPIWHCVCECGRKGNMTGRRLISFGRYAQENPGYYFGCGHCYTEIGRIKKADPKYRSTYRAWHNMKRRCLDKNNPGYKNYGGRGIGIYSPWIKGFQAFLNMFQRLSIMVSPEDQ